MDSPFDKMLKETGYTFIEIADAVGVSRETFWRLRKFPKNLTIRDVENLKKFLHVDFDEIVRVAMETEGWNRK